MTGSRVLVACLLVVVSSLLLSGIALGGHDPANTDYTVTPGDRDPGATGVDYTLEVEITDEFDGTDGIDAPSRFTFAVEGADLDACAAGSGEFADTDHSLSVEPSDGDAATYDVNGSAWDDNGVLLTLDEGDHPSVGVGDTLVFELAGCVAGPTDPGWYRGFAEAVGESDSGETVQLRSLSHYFGICAGCADDRDARSELGPPPSGPNPTPTATATPTPTATATPTPTATATPTPTSTATRTATPAVIDTPTPTPTSTGPDTGKASPTGQRGSTGEAAGTPTAGDGGGFGAGAVFAAVSTLVVVLGRRR